MIRTRPVGEGVFLGPVIKRWETPCPTHFTPACSQPFYFPILSWAQHAPLRKPYPGPVYGIFLEKRSLLVVVVSVGLAGLW